MTRPHVLRSQHVVLPDEIRPAYVRVEDGRIVDVADDSALTRNAGVEDLGDLVILPGCVDLHVHLNEPGRTDWEGFRTGTHAAAAGGTTTLVDMPLNSIPPTIDAQGFLAKTGAAEGALAVDVALYGGLVSGSANKIPELLKCGVAGVKAFLIDSGVEEFPASAPEDLSAAMRLLAGTGVPLLAHAELPAESSIPRPDGKWTYRDWLASRPQEMEVRAIELLVDLVRETGASLHVVHVACAEAADVIRTAKQEGLPVTAETCPHYLAFAAEDIPADNTLFKCAPPIREGHHREALWEALEDGTLDLIATDHSPAPPELKGLNDGDFCTAWGGISSLQFLFSTVWRLAAERGHDLHTVSRWLSAAPAQVTGFGERKGAIAPGRDADLIIVDSDALFTIERRRIVHRHPITPWLNQTVRGRVLRTILRGETIWSLDGLVPERRGRILKREANPAHEAG